jgi:predicted ferric reductase
VRDGLAWWLTSRATGIVAYIALTGSMLAGLASRTRTGQRLASPLARLEWHKALSVAGLVLALAHVLTLLGSARDFSPADLLVPGVMPYRPFWSALGVVALWALIALAITGPMRARLGPGAWHLIHRGAYAVFIAVTAHGVMVGTDSARLPMLAMYVTAVALVGGLAVRRVIAPPSPVRRPSR